MHPWAVVRNFWQTGGLHAHSVSAHWHRQFAHPLGRFGVWPHIVLALVWCAAASGPTAAVELLGLGVAGCLLLRLPFLWRTLLDAVRQPAFMFGAAWAIWLCASALWTSDVDNARHELSFLRWMWTPLALWGVIVHRAWMIVALKVGFGLALLAQVGEWIGYRHDVAALVWSHPPAPDPAARISGWWHQPAVGGAMLVLALGLHVGPALLGTGWRRWLACACCCATLVGIVLTGARGGLVAAALLLGVMGVVAIWVSRGTRRGWELVALGAIVVVVASAALASPMGAKVRKRAERGLEEVRRVVAPDIVSSRGERDAPNYNTDTGARLYAGSAAIRTWLDHPLLGAGAGSFQRELRDDVQERTRAGNAPLEPRRQDALKTAHNTLLHALATTGLVGAVLLFATLASAIASGCAIARAAPGTHATHWLGTSAAGPALALVGLVLAGLFETTYLNLSTAAMSCVLIALCPRVLPTKT